MTIRLIQGDFHFGNIGLGHMALSAANAFSAINIDNIIEPDVILKELNVGRRVISQDIDDLLVWDIRNWIVKTLSDGLEPDVAGGEDLAQIAKGGIVKDNDFSGLQPTVDTIAQGTHPGGNLAAVAGAAAGGGDAPVSIGQDVVEYEFDWEYMSNSNEEQTAVGHILHNWRNTIPRAELSYPMYLQDGWSVHQLLTAGRYHQWADSEGLSSGFTQSLGMNARRVSIDLLELIFDRGVLLTLLDALTFGE